MKTKIFTLFVIFIMALPILVSCNSETDGCTIKDITLSASNLQIIANGVDAADLTLKLGDDLIFHDVTYTVNGEKQAITGNKFTSSKAGSFVIIAEYKGHKSNQIIINATEEDDLNTGEITVVLSSDKTQIVNNGTDIVTFTVMVNGEDKTNSATIKNRAETLTFNTF